MGESLLDVRGAAEYLGCSVHSVYRWSAQGLLPCVKVGRLTRFRPVDLRAWVERQSAGAA